jgi:hypothetical protein
MFLKKRVTLTLHWDHLSRDPSPAGLSLKRFAVNHHFHGSHLEGTQVILILIVHNETALKLQTAIGKVLLLAAASIGRGESIDFDNATVRTVPAGWMVTMTRTGAAPRWGVLKDDSAPGKPNVLAQVSTDRTAGRFPSAIWDRASLKDGTLSVKFKAVSGSVDHGAGLVWRCLDAKNYYIVRANALGDNVALYKVQNGERVSLAPKSAVSNTYGVKHRVPKQTWTTLIASFHGNLFSVSLDGQKLFDVEGSTFTGAGRTGLWTKADSVIEFDDLAVSPL